MSAKIAQALHQVMSAVSYVQKTGKNAFHGYKYAGEADLLEKLRPAMLEAGLLLLPSVRDVSPIDEHGITTVRMEYTLIHKDGDIWPHTICSAGQGGDRNKNGVGDKGLYKAITGANKYLLFKLFQIETGDDPEFDAPHDSTPAKRENPHVTRPADILDGTDTNVLPRHDIDVPTLSKAKANPLFKELQGELWRCGSIAEMQAWGETNKNRIGQLPDDWYKMLRGVYVEHQAEITKLNAGDETRMAS